MDAALDNIERKWHHKDMKKSAFLRMFTMISSMFFLGVFMGAGVSCKTTAAVAAESPSGFSLDNTTWRVLAVTNAGKTRIVQEKEGVRFPEITFGKEGALGGTTGVNRFFGKYTLNEDGTITFGEVGMSRMMGLNPEAKENEKAFTAALKKVVSYSISGTSSGKQLRFFDAKRNEILLCEPETRK
ncbi:MAG: hypothetical protein Ta2A_14940 [Treponemataceae bacterium]|nr:MAG: hypothetical protein Ta2A_14940 [Treponemataceae bacterium]